MARLLPSDVTELSLSLGHTAELRTLDALRRGLTRDYTVFHSVHWSLDGSPRPRFGEADFVVVNRAGAALVIEQKAGRLEETADGLVKRYGDRTKSVAHQIHRTLDAIRDQYKRQSRGGMIDLDYLVYCPDHRVGDLNAVGLVATRIVDARDAARLPQRVAALLGPGSPSEHGERARRFFEGRFHLVPDIHAHVTAGERAMVRLSGGLADTVAAIEMTPLRLRVRGTAGSGKSTVAGRIADRVVQAGRRPLLVCFNRPLAEKLRATAPKGATVATFMGLMDAFLKARGHTLDYAQIGKPGFWQEVQERVIAEPIPPDWRFGALIVDEGQDFEAEWIDILHLFLEDEADILWLEDPDQTIRPGAEARLATDGFVGFRARANHRSPETIARYIRRVLPFEFEPMNPLPGLGVGVATYKRPEAQGGQVAAVVTDLLKSGFRHGDIAILSLRGLSAATLAREKRVGNYTLSRPTGEYDLLGNQVFEPGQLRFDTVYRFKGQQAPAVIVTDIDPEPEKRERAERLLFSAMTRATVRLDLLVREGETAERLRAG